MDLGQFWPSGDSDGDTAHVRVEEFAFEGRLTNAFVSAAIGGKPVIHKDGTVVVRWQGIDCPELHCGRSVWYRQHWGQAPSVHLAAFLRDASHGAAEVPVQVVTRVRRPEDVFDKYRRFIGDVLLGDGTNLNHWMLSAGWAFPSLYDSLEADEVRAYLGAAAQAKSPLLADYTTDLRLWDPKLQSPRRKVPRPAYDEAEDRGWVQYPKLFRRIVDFHSGKGAGAASVRDFLGQRSHQERVFLTRNFLEQGPSAATRSFAQFIDDGDQFRASPGDLVFPEAPSTLLDAAGDRVTDW
jgi:endonuclease YncB( thermonuclease family)